MVHPVKPAATPPRLDVRGLVKRFRQLTAVDGFYLTIAPGELVGLVGPNGAGKSTAIKIMTGQLLADAGQVLIDGHDIAAEPLLARTRLGYVPQELTLYPFLTGREVLEFVAEVRQMPPPDAAAAIDELLARFRLTEAQHRLAREYSEGMARKLAISAALLGDPALLILDESLNGLDPRASAEVKAVVAARLRQGTAVLLVSHILEHLERLCSRVVLLHRGRVIHALDRADLDRMRAAGETLEELFLAHTE